MVEIPVSKKNIQIGKEYNKVALEGFMEFLESLYEDLLNDINKGTNPIEAIKSELNEVKRLKKVWIE